MEKPQRKKDIIGRPERHGWNLCMDKWEDFIPTRKEIHDALESGLVEFYKAKGIDDDITAGQMNYMVNAMAARLGVK